MARESDTDLGIRAVPPAPSALPFLRDPQNEIRFERVEQTTCPYCKKSMSTAAHAPLSHLACLTCGKQVLVPGRLGVFRLHDHIGEGEMGSIYRATDESLGREVAIKLVRMGQADAPESRERLTREACAAGKLNHPRVAQVYSLNFSNGHPYLVMELVSGLDFAKQFEREGPVNERTALRMALDVADGLSALHREGLVHGDIKPANIVLDRDGNAKLVDFGLSGMTRHDGQGNFIGTPFFIAPELLHGVADTHQSDLYSLGATLYYLLSGRLTHEGATPSDILKARLTQKPVPLDKHARHLSPATRRLIMHMIEPSPAKRPANSEIVAAEIREALALLETSPRSAGVPLAHRMHRTLLRLRLPRLPWRQVQARRHRRAWLLLAITAVSAGTIAVAALHPACAPHRTRLRKVLARHDEAADAIFAWWQGAVSRIRRAAGRDQPPPPSAFTPDTSPHAAFTAENGDTWFTMTLGAAPQRGSAIYAGGTLILQSSGAAMWEGPDCCRYVWNRAEGTFDFSAALLAYADNDPYAMTGLLVKGPDPAQGPGLFFGVLGNGDLALQLRREDGERVLVKREPARQPAWRYLALARAGDTFTARVSDDGGTWQEVATHTLSLPNETSVGFVVTPHTARDLATAKFAKIRLGRQAAP
ncbi:MAG: serine/threonine-protein kinase [Kiritimatiellia bacterium]